MQEFTAPGSGRRPKDMSLHPLQALKRAGWALNAAVSPQPAASAASE